MYVFQDDSGMCLCTKAYYIMRGEALCHDLNESKVTPYSALISGIPDLMNMQQNLWHHQYHHHVLQPPSFWQMFIISMLFV